MTREELREELREAVARALVTEYTRDQRRHPTDRDREALREPTPAMCSAANLRPLNSEGFYKEWNPWRAMLAASPLGDK